jgi:phosphoribosylformimino-5-aminoimidazole carboxamide ribotide isomerase
MILFPAIDLKGGACVRLLHGEMSAATVFNDDPAAQARDFAAAGFEWLHVVDLDGAFAGRSVNGPAVAAIVAATGQKATGLKVQLGGGIRNEAQIASWLDHGINRVVLGTVALRDPALVKAACRTHPGRIVVGIDARRGRVAVEGWAETSEVSARELALRFEDAGVAAIVYTDIDRDGALVGVNVEATAALAADLTTPVIASGGVASLEDLKKLKAREADGIAGVICGRALYDGRIDPARALSLLRDPRPAASVPAC